MQRELNCKTVIRYFWVKKTLPDGASSLHPERPCNAVECILVGLHHEINGEIREWQMNYNHDEMPLSNVIECDPVCRPFAYKGVPVLPQWQKPRRLMRLLIRRHCHCAGEWIFEPLCGVASGSVAALTMGMNVVALDEDFRCAAATKARFFLLQIKSGPNKGLPCEEKEITTKERWNGLVARKKSKKEIDDLEEEEDAESTDTEADERVAKEGYDLTLDHDKDGAVAEIDEATENLVASSQELVVASQQTLLDMAEEAMENDYAQHGGDNSDEEGRTAEGEHQVEEQEKAAEKDEGEEERDTGDGADEEKEKQEAQGESQVN